MSTRVPTVAATALFAVSIAFADHASATPIANALAMKNIVPTVENVRWGGGGWGGRGWGWGGRGWGGRGWGVGGGLIAGAIIGGALAAPYYYDYGPYYYPYPRTYYYGPPPGYYAPRPYYAPGYYRY